MREKDKLVAVAQKYTTGQRKKNSLVFLQGLHGCQTSSVLLADGDGIDVVTTDVHTDAVVLLVHVAVIGRGIGCHKHLELGYCYDDTDARESDKVGQISWIFATESVGITRSQ